MGTHRFPALAAAEMRTGTMRSLIALGLGLLAIMCVVTLLNEDPTDTETVLVSAWAKKATKKAKYYKPQMKGEGKLRKRISDAIKVAAKSLRMAKPHRRRKQPRLQ